MNLSEYLVNVRRLSAGGPGSGRKKDLTEEEKKSYPRSAKHINKILDRLGYKERIGYKAGSGHVYWHSGKADGFYESSVGIANPKHLTIGRYIEDLEYKLKNDKNVGTDYIKNLEKRFGGKLEGGGPGSGRHPYGKKQKDVGRQARALASYNPSNRAKMTQAINNEKALAKIVQGAVHIGDNQPFDVIVKSKRIAFEVKTIVAGKRDAITMHKSSRERKEKAWKKMKLKQVYTVIFDDRNKKIYVGKGVKSFRTKLRGGGDNPSLIELKSLKDIKDLL